jgi:hypothetical protein
LEETPPVAGNLVDNPFEIYNFLYGSLKFCHEMKAAMATQSGGYEHVEEGKTNQSRPFLHQSFSVLLYHILCVLQPHCQLSSSNTDAILINTNMNFL